MPDSNGLPGPPRFVQRLHGAPHPPSGLGRRFADLKIRPKLMVLHNVFFLVLSCSVYFSIIPPFERRVTNAKTIEVSLITQMFAEDWSAGRLPKMDSYNLQEGTAESLAIPAEIRTWLDSHPGHVWQNVPGSDYLYRKDPRAGVYRRITLPNVVYDDVVERAKITLFIVLGIIYVLAVLLLELVIMPLYVYQPITLMLTADAATQHGDRERELIPESFIPADEIGQIMRSRNQTLTQLRTQEDTLERALERLEAQDRLASLGLLSASVAHELNTPLAVLHGSIEKLTETVPDSHAQERLARMLRVTRRLQAISTSLVDFARVRRQHFERVGVRTLLDEAWNLVAIDEKAAHVRFTNHVAEDHAVNGNPDRLMQVFVNLLRNSLNAVHDNGAISASSRRIRREGQASIEIAVEDNGPGIPADVLPDIFDAFVSSRLDAKGTGLGLTVAEGIVSQHGGQIAAANRAGGGARLQVTLSEAPVSVEVKA